MNDDPTASGAEPRARHFVQSLERGLMVLRAFDREHPTLTVAEAASVTGLSRGTVQRLLLTLVDLGYAVVAGKRFELQPKVFELGFAYLASHDAWDALDPVIQEVVDELGESCTVGVLDLPDVVYVARVQARRVVNATLTVGSRVPAHATSLGHVLLASLPEHELEKFLSTAALAPRTPNTITSADRLRSALDEVRIRGWAMGDEEFEEGVRSVSVPLRDKTGNVVAAMKVVTPKHRATKQDLSHRFLPVLRVAAVKAESVLRAR